MYGAPAYPSATTGPRIGEWLSEAFILFGREWLTWIGQAAIFLFVGCLPAIVGGFMYMGAILAYVAAHPSGSGGAGEFPTEVVAGLSALFIGLFASLFVAAFFWMGMERTAAKQLRGQPISVRDIFTGGDVYLPCLLALIALSILTSCASACLVLPMFIVSGMLLYVLPIIAEERVGVGEAISKSWNANKRHFWMNVLWALVLYLIQTAGSAVVIGYFVTMPLFALVSMIGYRDTFGMAGAVSAASAIPLVPPGPGVNYGPAGAPVTGARCPACEQPVAVGAVVCPHCGTGLTPVG